MGPYFVGVRELAREMGVSKNSARRAEKYCRIQRHPSGKFNLEKTKLDWTNNTHPGRGGKRAQSPVPPHLQHKPFLDFRLRLFSDSSEPAACELKRQTDWSAKQAWDFMALVFLIEWEVVSQLLVNGEELPLELLAVPELLATDEGKKQLEQWLKKKWIILGYFGKN